MAKKKPHQLTKKQQKFIDEYMKTGNARKSALLAGYSEHSADNASLDILGSSKVQTEIERRQKIVRDKYAHRLFLLGEQAINVQIRMLQKDGVKNRDRIRTAQDVLDRIGIGEAKKHEVVGEGGGPLVILMGEEDADSDEEED